MRGSRADKLASEQLMGGSGGVRQLGESVQLGDRRRMEPRVEPASERQSQCRRFEPASGQLVQGSRVGEHASGQLVGGSIGVGQLKHDADNLCDDHFDWNDSNLPSPHFVVWDCRAFENPRSWSGDDDKSLGGRRESSRSD